MKKRVVIFLSACLAILILWLGVTMVLEKSDTATNYITKTISRDSVVKVVLASGTVNPKHIVRVGAQVSGTILELYCDENDRVTKGHL